MPRVSLGTLFLAAQLIDIVVADAASAGGEQVRVAPDITAITPFDFTHYPVFHSLLALLYGWWCQDDKCAGIAHGVPWWRQI